MGYTFLKAKEYSLGVLNRGTYVYTFIKVIIVSIFAKKSKRDGLLNGVEEVERNFKFVKNTIRENNLKQGIRYRVPKHKTIDQLDNVFVFDLETFNNQEFAGAYAAGLYDVNCSRIEV